MQLAPASLVLYKQDAARVMSTGRKKIEIQRRDGETVSVRHKDVTLLHPGPLKSWSQLKNAPPGEVEIAWELLAGATTTLPELAELAYETYTPASAWAVWQLIDDGLYFHGTPEEIVVHTAGEVQAEQEARAAKEAQEKAWQAFVARAAQSTYAPEDEQFLREVEELAYGRYEQSRVMRDLGRAETPENAHAFLLELGYWSPQVNPYPVRLSVPTVSSQAPVEVLAEETRQDLTHLTALAIDDEGSNDADDAISLEETPFGPRLWVHVADAAALAPPRSAADLEARARGASLYLPEGTVRMLPAEANAQLALGLEEVSPALSLAIDLRDDGDQRSLGSLTVAPSCVRVTRLTYDEAEAQQDDPHLAPLFALAAQLQERRERVGAINIDLPEVKIRVVDGQVVIKPLPNLLSRNLVREAMLLAGEAVAQFAQDHNIPIPFTVQDPPDELEDDPGGLAGQFALRRTFRRSQASLTPGAHAGLGLPHYVQATSPLRRYLDLVVHQQLRAFIHDAPLLDEQEITERVGAAQAMRGDMRYAERLSNEHWTLVYLLQNSHWRGEGIIVEQYGKRSKVLIPALAIETQIYLRGDAGLNDTVLLEVAGEDAIDLAQRTVTFKEV